MKNSFYFLFIFISCCSCTKGEDPSHPYFKITEDDFLGVWKAKNLSESMEFKKENGSMVCHYTSFDIDGVKKTTIAPCKFYKYDPNTMLSPEMEVQFKYTNMLVGYVIYEGEVYLRVMPTAYYKE